MEFSLRTTSLGDATFVWVRPLLSAVAIAATMFPAHWVHAGLFEGFSEDGHYRRGSERVCSVVQRAGEVSKCETKSLKEQEGVVFQKGHPQIGNERVIDAKKRGTKIVVTARETGDSLFQWDTGQIVSEVTGVYLHRDGRSVAVEFYSRLGGRNVEDVVVFKLEKSVGHVEPVVSTADSVNAPAPAKPSVAMPVVPEAFLRALKSATKFAKRRKHKAALAVLHKALQIIPGHPHALYLQAKSQFARKDKVATLLSLGQLAQSNHKEVPRWRVEARFDKSFQSLRGEPTFRAAVGIDRGKGDVPSTYERLVALGGSWEQESVPCEDPKVTLDLQRKRQRFDLVIRSNCQGAREVTRLDGTWRTDGEKLLLRFPNMNVADEELRCQIERCTDAIGEDCLRCQPEKDIEFLLRTVRR